MTNRDFKAISLWLLNLIACGPFLASVAMAELAVDDPDLLALMNARTSAESSVSTGDHAAALDTLLQSLRDAPSDRPELVDIAYGNGQMISYVLLHVMPEPPAYAYLEQGFRPQEYETDKMVKVLCTIAIGLNNADKTVQSREAVYLTTSENQIVRLITMFYLSNPYFYDNQEFTTQYAEMLAEEAPDLDLTQTALNLSLYAESQKGNLPILAKESIKSGSKALPYKPWSESLRSRIRDCADNLESKDKNEGVNHTQAFAPLLRGVTEATNWRERHFALLLVKNAFATDPGSEMLDSARELAERPENTPDVLQARVLLATELSADAAHDGESDELVDEAVAVAEVLLDKGVDETTPERVMWETWAYGIRDCAQNLVAAGHKEEAIALYTSLSEKLPGSKISSDCIARIADLQDESTLQSTAR